MLLLPLIGVPHVVLEHEHRIERDRNKPQKEFSEIARERGPVGEDVTVQY